MGTSLGAMREDRRAVRRRPLARLASVVLVATGLMAGCTESSEKVEEPPPATATTATPLSELDLTGVVAERAPFCDALDPESVATVLGGQPELTDSYSSGEVAQLGPGLRDVANEHSCLFERGSRSARAWLFAQPVTPAQARTMVEGRGSDRACEAAGELSFGDPGLVQSCEPEGRRRVTAVGLFGDGWLTCQTTAPGSADATELLEQTQRWCAEVARSVSR